jgi:hypothetical protein
MLLLQEHALHGAQKAYLVADQIMRHAVIVIFKDVFGRGFLQNVLMRIDQKTIRPRRDSIL